MPKSKKVLFIMTGSIACYKATQVISRLVQNQIDVQVATTASALRFVGATTLEGLSGRPVAHDLYESGHAMDHIHLIRQADLVLVAPASANFINKCANGIADDLASTLFMAHDFKKPFLMAPAMNTSMYFHPATQSSLKKLKDYGVQILEAASGVLACGEVGYGKLLDPDLILQEILPQMNKKQDVTIDQTSSLKAWTAKAPLLEEKNPKILITAGGTQEKIDEVRRITNTSSGQTGFLIASTLQDLGLNVQLMLSENSSYQQTARSLWEDQLITYTDHKSLDLALQKQLQLPYDYVIHLAAVSDYQVAEVLDDHGKAADTDKKISSQPEELVLKLKKTKKIIQHLKSYSTNKKMKLIGFKLTIEATNEEVQTKVNGLFESCGCDWVVHNDLQQKDPTLRPYKIFSSKKDILQADNQDQLVLRLSNLILENWFEQQNKKGIEHDSLS